MSKQHLKVLATALALSASALVLSSCSNGSAAGTLPKARIQTQGPTVEVVTPQPDKPSADEPKNSIPWITLTPAKPIQKEEQPQQDPPAPADPEPEKPKTPTELTLPVVKSAISTTVGYSIPVVDPTQTASNITPSNIQATPTKRVDGYTLKELVLYGQDYKRAIAVNVINTYNEDSIRKSLKESTVDEAKLKAQITKATTNDTGVIDQAHVSDLLDLASKTNPNNDPKVILLGDELTDNSTNSENNKLSKDYKNSLVAYSADESNITKPLVSETEKALEALYGDGNVPGLLNKSGSVAFLGENVDKKSEIPAVYDLVSDAKFKELTSKGYNVIAVTTAPEAVTLEHIKTVVTENIDKKIDPDYDFDKRLDKTRDLLGTLDELTMLEGLANKYSTKDFDESVKLGNFFVFATGEGEGYNPFALSHFFKDGKFDNLKLGSVFVTTNSNKSTSLHCTEYNKFYCLTAYSDFTVDLTEAAKAKPEANSQTSMSASGTASAAAYVAGTAALVKSVFPFFTPENLQTTLLTTAKQIGDTRVSEQYGWGLVQPQEAVQGPKQILNGKLVVDLSNNNTPSTQKVYNFNNAISGTGDLVVKSQQGNNSVLSINNKNTYTGNTYFTDYATVQVTGHIASPIVEITNGANVYSNGTFYGTVKNQGDLYAYLPGQADEKTANLYTADNLQFKSDTRNSPNSLQSLHIKGNLEQDKQGTLHVTLGAPVIVHGEAKLSGKIVVDGIASGLLLITVVNNSYDNLFYSDVVIAKKLNQYTADSIEVKLNPSKLTYFGLNYKDALLNPYSIDGVPYYSLMLRFTPYTPTRVAVAGSDNLDVLMDDVSENYKSLLNNYTLALSEGENIYSNSVADNTVANSGLSKLVVDLKTEGDEKVVNDFVKAFSGQEFTETVEHNQMLHQAALNKATSQLFTFDSNGATNATVSTDYLAASNGATSYLTAVNANYQLGQHKLAIGVNQGGSSWKHSQATEKNQHTTFGGTLGYATQLNKDFGVNAYAGYQYSSNDLVRNLNILDTAYNHNDKLVVDETVLGANFFYNVPVPAQFQVFLGANQHWSKTGAVTEQYGKDAQAYRLELGKNTVNYTNLVVGAQFTQANLLGAYGWNGLDLNASYSLAYSVNNWNELSAQLADNMLTVKQTYARSNPSKLTHQAALSLTQKLDDTFSVGAKASLLSAKETYKSLGLYLNARF